MEAKVVGVTFNNEDTGINRQKIISKLSGKEKIYLKREYANPYDKNAVAVMLKRKEKDLKIGYLRSELASFIAKFWPDYKFTATISQIRTGNLDDNIPYGISIDIRKRKRSGRR